MARNRKRVAVVPGDDAAPEAVHATLGVLRAMALPLDWEVLPDGETLAATLSRSEAETLIRAAADRADTVLFGATSGKTGGIGYFRWIKGAYANVRPIRWRPGFHSPLREPEGIDYVIIRENIEDLYLGVEGDLADLRDKAQTFRSRRTRDAAYLDGEGKYALKVITRANTERVAHFACALARRRMAEGHPGKVTCAAKYNVLPVSDGFFRDTVRDIVTEYPDLEFEEFIVDDFARRIVQSPHDLDVVLLPNLYGDVLSDEGAGTIGGLGLSPSGCYGDGWAYFESVHGSAPDIAGRHVINPTATMLSAAMMLAHLGLEEEAGRLDRAISEAYSAGDSLTPDQGGSGTTEAFADAVAARL